jgi:3-oxoacyl-[acyl-carrier-protein] synthase II
MEMNRVAITGIGAICGLGHNLKQIWPKLILGESGICRFHHLSEDYCPIPMGGIVNDFTISTDLLEAKDQDRFDKFIHFALHSSQEALENAGVNPNTYLPYRMGTILGVGLGGFPLIENTHTTFMEKGPRRVSPFFIPGIIPNMATGLISMRFGLKGINHAISSACASSAHALAAAANEIMLGRQDLMLTGGAEMVTSPLTIAGFHSMKALSKKIETPTIASRPFDQDRDGFVIGEGAGILILENLELAKKRGAKILAEIVGHGATSDAYHITAPHPEGEGTIPCMQQALAMAGITPEKIDYINAHGTSTPMGDIAETKAIKKVFADHAYALNISSTKSMTGHLLGAAGGLESVFCIKTLLTGDIPPTINLDNPDEQCDLNYTPLKSINRQMNYVFK